MNLTTIKYAAVTAALFGAGFGAATVWKNLEIANLKLEHRDERIAKDRAARAQAERHLTTLGAAQNSAAKRAADLAVVVAGSRTELERLRDANAAMRAASSTLEACTAHAATQGGLFDQCAADLVDLAAQADGHVSDIRALDESWPR